MPRFALLEHDHPSPHLDLLFDAGEVLWAWRLEALPPESAAAEATRNFDHRLLYLDYEGPISGGRGEVRRLDGGDFGWVENSAERLVAEMRGRVLAGRLELTHVEGERWLLRWFGTSGEKA
jgi:hypothetical protein